MSKIDTLINETKIIVSDAMPSSGKTTKIIEQMANDENSYYIYATPTLSECHRIANTLYDPVDEFKLPLCNIDNEYIQTDSNHPLLHRQFKHPTYNDKNGKLGSLKHLIENNQNIVTTHNLFEMLNDDVVNLIKMKKTQGINYKLVLDETLGVWSTYSRITNRDLDDRIKEGVCSIDPVTGLVTWKEEVFKSDNSKYADFAEKCNHGQIYYVSKRVMYYEIPSHLFGAFKEVHILTYMFEHSELACFLRLHDIKYTVNKWGKSLDDIIPLIHILDHDKLNNMVSDITFSKLKAPKNSNVGLVAEMKNNLHNLYHNIWDAPAKQRLWTTAKDISSKVGNRRYNKSFLCFNTRGTNDYKHTTHLAYLLSVYMNPFLVRLVNNRGDKIDEEMYALSSMLQWIFRSAIRDDQEIYLYVPSVRMRGILLKYLNGQYDDKL